MKYIVLIEIYIVYLSSGQVFGDCLDEWTSYAGSCYALVDAPETWAGAAEICERFGGYLVEITSSDENDFVKRFVKARGTANVWTGGSDLLSAGHWRWLYSRDIITYFEWASGQPSFGSTIRCIQLWSENAFSWDDTACDFENAFVCETGTDGPDIVG
ncbi:perlucin-like protein [Haliotis cracherodii]|uniref:perlucin-like protein n=1 Tax=Haliotis cracherodii TaxID=6455 RepID=UPI0039EBD635